MSWKIPLLFLFCSLFITHCQCATLPPPSHADGKTIHDAGTLLDGKQLDHRQKETGKTSEQVNTLDGKEKRSDSNSSIDEIPPKEALCNNGQKRRCPIDKNQNKKVCNRGKQTCAGREWGRCIGQTLITPEVCNGKDDDCDGATDNIPCYTGPKGTAGVGLCHGGKYRCKDNKNTMICRYQYLPLPEICDMQDNNCNGKVDEGSACANPPKLGQMVSIPAGFFIIGVTPGKGYPNEYPTAKVYLNAFQIMKYEVTNQEYQACVKANACPSIEKRTSKQLPKGYLSNPKYALFPVVQVDSWREASVYCRWKGMELPSEAQWERVAKGKPKPGGVWKKYPWGAQLNTNCEYANAYSERNSEAKGKTYKIYFNCGKFPARVGSYPKGASDEGVHDLGGNVREWTKDCYAEWYGLAKEYKNPVSTFCNKPEGNMEKNPFRSVRGASFMRTATTTRRHKLKEQDQRPDLGFRCVKNTKIP